MQQFATVWVHTFWLFLPALVANQCPGFVAYVARKWWAPFHIPVHAHWFGTNKTWSAYYAGPLGAVITLLLQGRPAFVLGVLMGLGAVLGDHGESFIKRRLSMPPGKAFWPWDQIDFVIGSAILSFPLLKWQPDELVIIMLSMLVIHPVGNYVGMLLGLRKTWW